MKRVHEILVTIAAVCVAATATGAQKPQTGGAKLQRIDACSLLTRAEVKEHLPWPAMLDQFASQRDDIGESGSGCSYPSAHIQVLSYTPNFFDAARKVRKQEALSGVGDEAYVAHNSAGYAEVLAKVGPRIVTVQASIGQDGTYESVKPKAIALAKALVARLSAR